MGFADYAEYAFKRRFVNCVNPESIQALKLPHVEISIAQRPLLEQFPQYLATLPLLGYLTREKVGAGRTKGVAHTIGSTSHSFFDTRDLPMCSCPPRTDPCAGMKGDVLF